MSESEAKFMVIKNYFDHLGRLTDEVEDRETRLRIVKYPSDIAFEFCHVLKLFCEEDGLKMPENYGTLVGNSLS